VISREIVQPCPFSCAASIGALAKENILCPDATLMLETKEVVYVTITKIASLKVDELRAKKLR